MTQTIDALPKWSHLPLGLTLHQFDLLPLVVHCRQVLRELLSLNIFPVRGSTLDCDSDRTVCQTQSTN